VVLDKTVMIVAVFYGGTDYEAALGGPLRVGCE
jgi:hypothetical protein